MLWGNIREPVPAGFLVKFVDGFSSPPHIHNITYRAVVISGEVHNDDPDAEPMWMGPGSFWTQPAGESHITAAKGKDTTVFLEILEGPYLVRPVKQAFDNGERPINIDARNLIWLDASASIWVSASDKSESAAIAHLWGDLKDDTLNGTFLKLPAGFSGEVSGDDLRAVVISGTAGLTGSDGGSTTLDPGSYFGSKEDATHSVTCEKDDACVLYIHSMGSYSVAPS